MGQIATRWALPSTMLQILYIVWNNLLQSGGHLSMVSIDFNTTVSCSVGSNPRCPELPDYVVPATAASDSDHRGVVLFVVNMSPSLTSELTRAWLSNIAPPLMASVTGIGMNATSQRQSENQSHRSASNYTKIPTHAILTSRTAMILFGMAKRQSQMSASNMQLPTHLVLSAVMDGVSEGPSQTYVSNQMQFQQHNLNSMRNDQSGRYPTPATHISIIPTASTGQSLGLGSNNFIIIT
ncbi:hypothetical protein Tco_0586652 [Tanacetum coccineum]